MNDDKTSLTQTLARMASLEDYEAQAERALDAGVWAHLNAGSADRITERRNRAAFAETRLWPRLLRPARQASTGIELFGTQYQHPIFIAPTAHHNLAHADAERGTVMAASAMKTGMVVSTQSSITLEDLARISQYPMWFQLYMQSVREVTLDLVQRAERAGYRAIVLTVDAPIQGLRNEETRQGYQPGPQVRSPNLSPYAAQLQSSLRGAKQSDSFFQHPLIAAMPSWDDVAWLIGETRLPVLIKGILHPADVPLALQTGAAGLIVSNHGGRVLDGVPASLEALPGIVRAVEGKVPVLMDGGVRRGTDVLKALALGAHAVMIGRPVLHGLAVAGATGVSHVLHLLRSELETAMVLAGIASPADAHQLLMDA